MDDALGRPDQARWTWGRSAYVPGTATNDRIHRHPAAHDQKGRPAITTGQRPPGLESEGAPSRIRTCAHGSGDHGPLGDGTHCELRKRTAWARLGKFSIAILSRAPGAWKRCGRDVAGRHRYAEVRPGVLLVDLVQLGPVGSRQVGCQATVCWRSQIPAGRVAWVLVVGRR